MSPDRTNPLWASIMEYNSWYAFVGTCNGLVCSQVIAAYNLPIEELGYGAGHFLIRYWKSEVCVTNKLRCGVWQLCKVSCPLDHFFVQGGIQISTIAPGATLLLNMLIIYLSLCSSSVDMFDFNYRASCKPISLSILVDDGDHCCRGMWSFMGRNQISLEVFWFL